jgi:hypothetical protein
VDESADPSRVCWQLCMHGHGERVYGKASSVCAREGHKLADWHRLLLLLLLTGGVAVSGLEMAQNAMMSTWSSEEVDHRLKVGGTHTHTHTRIGGRGGGGGCQWHCI